MNGHVITSNGCHTEYNLSPGIDIDTVPQFDCDDTWDSAGQLESKMQPLLDSLLGKRSKCLSYATATLQSHDLDSGSVCDSAKRCSIGKRSKKQLNASSCSRTTIIIDPQSRP